MSRSSGRQGKGTASGAAAATGAQRDRLVLALCHELGNLLTGIRLSAHVVARSQRGAGEARDVLEIEDLAAHAGVLLAQIRPLLDGVASRPVRVAPVAVLEAVERALVGSPVRERLEVAAVPPLPDLAVDPDAVQHTLLSIVRAACSLLGPSGRIVVSAEPAGRRVALRVRDDAPVGSEPPPRPGALRRGRDLTLAVAREIVERSGGSLRVRLLTGSPRGRSAGTEIALLLPIADEGKADGASTPRGVRSAGAAGRGRGQAVPAGPKRGRASRGPSGRSS